MRRLDSAYESGDELKRRRVMVMEGKLRGLRDSPDDLRRSDEDLAGQWSQDVCLFPIEWDESRVKELEGNNPRSLKYKIPIVYKRSNADVLCMRLADSIEEQFRDLRYRAHYDESRAILEVHGGSSDMGELEGQLNGLILLLNNEVDRLFVNCHDEVLEDIRKERIRIETETGELSDLASKLGAKRRPS